MTSAAGCNWTSNIGYDSTRVRSHVRRDAKFPIQLLYRRHLQRLQPEHKPRCLRSFHYAVDARRAREITWFRARFPMPTPTSFRPTTHSCPARPVSPPTRPSPISTGISAPRTFWRRNTTTSTIPQAARPMPTPTCPDSPRTWTPARRSARSTTSRPSAPLSASLRPSAFFARRPTPPTIRPSGEDRHRAGMNPGLRQLLSRFHHQRRHRRSVRFFHRAALRPHRAFARHRPQCRISGSEHRRLPEPHHALRHGHLGQGTPLGQLRRQLVLHPVEYCATIAPARAMWPRPILSPSLDNWVTPYSTQNFTASTFLQGNANRYYRANETGCLHRTSSRSRRP
jgi:hypothetical protein